MDSKTVQLFVNLGLPLEIVILIENHLIDNYRKEHRDNIKINDITFIFESVNFSPLRNHKILNNMDMFVQLYKEAIANGIDPDEVVSYIFFTNEGFEYHTLSEVIKYSEMKLKRHKRIFINLKCSNEPDEDSWF